MSATSGCVARPALKANEAVPILTHAAPACTTTTPAALSSHARSAAAATQRQRRTSGAGQRAIAEKLRRNAGTARLL